VNEKEMSVNNPDVKTVSRKMLWYDYSLWKIPAPGVWAWFGTRVSAVLILIFFVLHLFYTYSRLVQFLLLLTVVFHAFLGIRVIVIDFGLNTKTRKPFTVALAAFSIFIFCLIWYTRY
jgi:succinate dehydrogenase / fumarate reductase cytochrome b subunit